MVLLASVFGAVVYPILLPVGGLLAVIYWVVGALYRGVVTGMRNRAAWAFLLGMVLTGGSAALNLYGLLLPPQLAAQQPEWMQGITVVTVLAWLYVAANLAASACASMGLVLALARPRSRPRLA